MGTETANLKKCPACAQQIPAEASMCAYCRTKVNPVDSTWWQASDGLWYPAFQHPDFLNRPAVPRAPMSRKTKRNMIVGFSIAIVLFVGSGLAWRADLFGIKCDYYRRELQEAKAASDGYSPDVSQAARTARANGCDVDDLISPEIGR